MRIAIFIPTMLGGGAERSMATLASEFAARDISVDLVLVTEKGPNLHHVSDRVRIVDLSASGVMSAIPGLVRYMRRQRPDVLLSVMGHTNVAALIAGMLARTKTRIVVSDRMSLLAREDLFDSPRERLVRFLMRRLYPRADAVIVVADKMIGELAQRFGLDRSRIYALPNPVVGADLLRQADEQPTEAWWPMSGQGPLIVAAGRLSAQKDFPTLIKAFAEVRKTMAARLLILGEGEDRAALEALIQQRELSDHILMPGFVDNPFAIMRRADLFVLSSLFEGLPGVLIQAMACGTPVVSTDCPTGPDEILENGKWGRLVPVGDASALAAAMIESLRARNRPDVSQRAAAYSEDVAASRYLEVLIGDPPSPNGVARSTKAAS